MLPQLYPILEFDDDKDAMINPSMFFTKKDAPDICIYPFFKKLINNLEKRNIIHPIAQETTIATDPLSLFEMNYKNRKIAVVTPGLGASFAAGILEFAIAHGCTKFIVIGTCGTLNKGLTENKLIVPTSAIRDEGTSYHYVSPYREIIINPKIQQQIKSYLDQKQISFVEGKVWTTDAFYRETNKIVQQRKSEGAIAVEMELAALSAVSQFREVSLGSILITADDLSRNCWDPRNFGNAHDFYEKLFWLAADICMNF